MIKIAIYQVTPYLTEGIVLQDDDRNNRTSWLRAAINMMMNRRKADLLKAGANIDLFHNHDTSIGQNKKEYPKIFYQSKGNQFFVVGIDEGKYALEQLFLDCRQLVYISDHLALKIGIPANQELLPAISDHYHKYELIDWLPLSNQSDKDFDSLISLAEKVSFLENRLKAHLLNDFFRYLNIPVDSSKVQLVITDIDNFLHRKVMVEEDKHVKKFRAFSVKFRTNLFLPDHICLGNKKVYGFGLIEVMKK